MTAAITVQEKDVVVRLVPEPGANYVTADDLLNFARIAVANAGPNAAILVSPHGLNAHRATQVPTSSGDTP